MNQLLIVVIAFVSLLLAVSIFYHLSLSKSKQEKFAEPKLKIMLFYATWCPHCERYLDSGKYDDLSKKFSEKYNVEFLKYDYDKNKVLGDKYNISSFPTIIAEDKDGKVFKFSGDRGSEEDVEAFIKKHV